MDTVLPRFIPRLRGCHADIEAVNPRWRSFGILMHVASQLHSGNIRIMIAASESSRMWDIC